MIARLLAFLRTSRARLATMGGYWGGVMTRALAFLRRG